ncbi:MAG: hypothetical protein BYD32DRAFT_485192 [Podila humilis]|nr:MAG: hypothetical protein BYD32DRAFT_485192 [Podila humilis]
MADIKLLIDRPSNKLLFYSNTIPQAARKENEAFSDIRCSFLRADRTSKNPFFEKTRHSFVASGVPSEVKGILRIHIEFPRVQGVELATHAKRDHATGIEDVMVYIGLSNMDDFFYEGGTTEPIVFEPSFWSKGQLTNFDKCLPDDDSRQVLDESLSQEAIDMRFQKLAGRYRPAEVAVEKAIDGSEHRACTHSAVSVSYIRAITVLDEPFVSKVVENYFVATDPYFKNSIRDRMEDSTSASNHGCVFEQFMMTVSARRSLHDL